MNILNVNRKVSVAPMMDYMDARGFRCLTNDLRWPKMSCTSFVTANLE